MGAFTAIIVAFILLLIAVVTMGALSGTALLTCAAVLLGRVDGGSAPHRIAMLLLFSGPTAPPFFPIFLHFAELQKEKADWFIFTDLPESLCAFYTHDNVFVVNIGRADMVRRITGAVGGGSAEAMDRLLATFPYALVELKPLLATMFAEYVPQSSYPFWGYFDMDTVVSHLPGADEMKGLDLYTSSYGDNNRLYIRGQLTILRNTDSINNLWRRCETLSGFGDRLQDFLRGALAQRWRFESVEACFSRAVFDDPKVRVRIRTDQLSDASAGSALQREFSHARGGLHRCDGREYLFEQRLVDAQLRLNSSNSRCSYWMNPKYALCLEGPPAALLVEITRVDGRLFASSILPSGAVPAGCRQASLGHFQGFKKHYYQTNTLVDLSMAERIVFTQHGVIGISATAHSTKGAARRVRLHCLRFTPDLKTCALPLPPSSIVSQGNERSPRRDELTLIQVAPGHDSGGLWAGPRVLVRVCSSGCSPAVPDSRVTAVDIDYAPAGESSAAAAVYNVALDAARTDLVLLLPAGAPLPAHALLEAARASVAKDPLRAVWLEIPPHPASSPPLLSRALLFNASGSAHGRIAGFPEELGACRDALLFVLQGTLSPSNLSCANVITLCDSHTKCRPRLLCRRRGHRAPLWTRVGALCVGDEGVFYAVRGASGDESERKIDSSSYQLPHIHANIG